MIGIRCMTFFGLKPIISQYIQCIAQATKCIFKTAKQMLDDFYPRALQWCSTDDIPYNLVIVDISNSYPNVRLNDTHNTFAQYL